MRASDKEMGQNDEKSLLCEHEWPSMSMNDHKKLLMGYSWGFMGIGVI
jgi:hypothetical protein